MDMTRLPTPFLAAVLAALALPNVLVGPFWNSLRQTPISLPYQLGRWHGRDIAITESERTIYRNEGGEVLEREYKDSDGEKITVLIAQGAWQTRAHNIFYCFQLSGACISSTQRQEIETACGKVRADLVQFDYKGARYLSLFWYQWTESNETVARSDFQPWLARLSRALTFRKNDGLSQLVDVQSETSSSDSIGNLRDFAKLVFERTHS